MATGIFSPTARRVIVEGCLSVAYRLGHPRISTGHLLLAVLDSQDRTRTAITRPHTQRLARTLNRGLPGAHHEADDGALAWIQFDSLIRTLTPGFRRILPAGWTIWGTAGDSLVEATMLAAGRSLRSPARAAGWASVCRTPRPWR